MNKNMPSKQQIALMDLLMKTYYAGAEEAVNLLGDAKEQITMKQLTQMLAAGFKQYAEKSLGIKNKAN